MTTATTAAPPAFLDGTVKGLFIDNAFVESVSGSTIATSDPASGEVLAEVHAAGGPDVDRAVRSARRAFETGAWPAMTASERGRVLWRLGELVDEHADELALLETLDNGKPIVAARRDDVAEVADMFRFYAGFATKNMGQTIDVSAANAFCYTLHEPVGVTAGIIPWNYPLALAAWKLGPALACGNTMIVKPAEQTPLSTLRLAELIREAGFPPGVVNVLNGHGHTAGEAIARHPDVDKVAFTGSTDTGRRVLEASMGNLKRVSLELGGKSPNIVFADADPAMSREGALWGIFYNMGQDCSAGSRLFVESGRFDDVVGQLVEDASKLRVGPGIDDTTDIGPIVSTEQLERVTGYLELARSEGAIAAGGNRVTDGPLARGNFVAPTIITDTSNDARVAREEIFGPVVTVLPFSDEDELIRKANDTVYGLAAGVWTRDVARAHDVARKLRAGTVWVNMYGSSDPAAPFGGYKQSGYGREKGSYALEEFTQVKCVWVSLERPGG